MLIAHGNEEAMTYDDTDICPVCGQPGDHNVCSIVESRDWSRGFDYRFDDEDTADAYL